jgi:hypothetical protein
VLARPTRPRRPMGSEAIPGTHRSHSVAEGLRRRTSHQTRGRAYEERRQASRRVESFQRKRLPSFPKNPLILFGPKPYRNQTQSAKLGTQSNPLALPTQDHRSVNSSFCGALRTPFREGAPRSPHCTCSRPIDRPWAGRESSRR